MGWFSKKPKAKAALDATVAIASSKDAKQAKDVIADFEANMSKSVQSMAAKDACPVPSNDQNQLVNHLTRVMSGDTNPVDVSNATGAGPLPVKKSKGKKNRKKSGENADEEKDENAHKHRKHHHHTHHHERHFHEHNDGNAAEKEQNEQTRDALHNTKTDLLSDTHSRPMLTPISEEQSGTIDTAGDAKVPTTPEFSPNDEPQSNTTILLDFGKKDSFGVKFVAKNSQLDRKGKGKDGSSSPRGSRMPLKSSVLKEKCGRTISPPSSSTSSLGKIANKSPKTGNPRNASPRSSVTPRNSTSPRSSSGDLSDRGRARAVKNLAAGPKILKKGKDVGDTKPTTSKKLKKSRDAASPDKSRKKKHEASLKNKTVNQSSSTKLLLDTTTAGEYESVNYASEANSSPVNSAAKLPKLRKDNNVQSYASLDTDFGGRRVKDNLVSPTPSFNDDTGSNVNPYIGDDYNPYDGENYFAVKGVESGVDVSEESVSQQKKRFNAQDTIVNPYAKDFDANKMDNISTLNEDNGLTPRSADALVAQHLAYGHLSTHAVEGGCESGNVNDDKINAPDTTFADELERYIQEHDDEVGDKKHIVVEERTHIVFEERTHILVDPNDEMANALSEHSGDSSPRHSNDKNFAKSSGKGSRKDELLKNGKKVTTIKKGGRTLTKGGHAKGFGKCVKSPGRPGKKNGDKSLQQQKNELLGDLVLNQGAAVVQEEGTVRNFTDSPRVFEYGVGDENGVLDGPLTKENGEMDKKAEGKVNLVVDTETKLYSRPVTPKLASVSDFSPCSNSLEDVLSPNTIEKSSTVGPRTPTKEHEELLNATAAAAHKQHDNAAKEIQSAWRKRQSSNTLPIAEENAVNLVLRTGEVAKVDGEKNDVTVFQSGKMVVGGTVSPIVEENTVSETGSSICAVAAGTVHANKKMTVEREGKNKLVISTKGKSRDKSPGRTDNSGQSTPLNTTPGKGRSRSPNKPTVTINNGENSGVTIIIQEQHSGSSKSLDTKGKGKDADGSNNNVTIFKDDSIIKDDTPRSKKVTNTADAKNKLSAIKKRKESPNKGTQGGSPPKKTDSPNPKRSISPTHNESSEQDSTASSSGLAGLKVSTLNRNNIVNPGAMSRNAKRDLQVRLRKTADEKKFAMLESKLMAEDNDKTEEVAKNAHDKIKKGNKKASMHVAARTHYYGPAKKKSDSRDRSGSAGERKDGMIEQNCRMTPTQKPRSPSRDQEQNSDSDNTRGRGAFSNKNRIVHVPSKTRVGKSNVPALSSGPNPPSLSVPTLGNIVDPATGSRSRENSTNSTSFPRLLVEHPSEDAGRTGDGQTGELSMNGKLAEAGSSSTQSLSNGNENGDSRAVPNPYFISANELSMLTTVAKKEREDFFRAKMADFQTKEEFWVDRSVQVMLERNAVQQARLGENCFFVHWYGERIPKLDEQVNNYGQPLPSSVVKNGRPLSPLSGEENSSGSSKKRPYLNSSRTKLRRVSAGSESSTSTYSGNKNNALNRSASPAGTKHNSLAQNKQGSASRGSSIEYKSGDVQLQLRKNSSVPIPLDTKTGKLLRQQGLTAENNLGRERPPKCNFDECRNSPHHWLKKVALKMKSLGYIIEEYNVFYESCGLLSFVCSWG